MLDRMKKPFHPDYAPGDAQRALFPDVSGNAVNGLGETTPRRATPVYWRDPATIAHGPLQQYFYARAGELESARKVTTRMAEDRGPAELDAVAAEPQEADAETFTCSVKEFALAHESDLVGIARMRPEWVFDDSAVEDPWIVVLGFAMDQRELAKGPPREGELSSADEVSRQYNRAARASKALANHIRSLGFAADARTGPMSGEVLMIPAAIAAGLGQLGKHGSMINDRLGASFRLAAVTTQLPLVADAPRDIGVDEVCAHCQLCTRLCPPEAIFPEKQWVRGELKWYVDFDKCIPYFNDTLGCGICVAECPWSLPGVAPVLTAKMAKRRFPRGGA